VTACHTEGSHGCGWCGWPWDDDEFLPIYFEALAAVTEEDE
jgi:hypothetical protein